MGVLWPMDGRKIGRGLLSLGMVAAGILHLVKPAPFVAVVPAYLPAPAALVFVSGVAEVAGGAGLRVPRLRRAAAWGLAALFVAVFPANVDMALHPPKGFSPLVLWLRLPFQLPLIAWALWAGEVFGVSKAAPAGAEISKRP